MADCGGAVLPEDPGLGCEQWVCKECGTAVRGDEVAATVKELEAEMMDTMDTETDKYRAIIDKYSGRLHPNHYQVHLKYLYEEEMVINLQLGMQSYILLRTLTFFLIVQLLLCKRYLAGSMRGQMSLAMVEERLGLMTEFITVFETVDPGLSKWRGKMLYQVRIKIDMCLPQYP